MSILSIILLVIGVWQIIFAFLMQTKNGLSSFFFKVIPFFSGCYCIFYTLFTSGIIKIG